MEPEIPAAALRLRDMLLAEGGRMLGLDPVHERLEQTPDKPCAIVIKTDLPRAPNIPLLDVVVDAWRPVVDPIAASGLADRALRYLALTRAWRILGTSGPPAGLIATDHFTTAIADHARISHQDFVDLTWQGGELLRFGMASTPWQDSRSKPRSVRFYSSREPKSLVLPERLPWISGFSTPAHIQITAAGFDDGLTVGHTTGPDGYAVITLPRGNNIAILTTLGGKLENIVRNPVLRQFYLPIARNEALKRSVRYEVDWRDPSRPRYFDDLCGADVVARLQFEDIVERSHDLPTRIASSLGAVATRLVTGELDTF